MGNPFEGFFDSGDVLERVGIDITAQARRGDLEPVRCRDAEISRVVDILLRQGKNNAALVGKAGVGKTAIVEGLAQRIASGEVPPALKDARLLGLDHVSMLAGTSFRGQYEDRTRRRIQALQADRIVPDRARPDKAIDVLDEACAHAQAMARVSPELDKLIRDRKKVEAMIRRGLTEEEGTTPEEPMPDLATVLQRFGEEIEELLGGRPAGRTAETAPEERQEDGPSGRQAVRPSLEDQRVDLD